jgi:hypothetical protein
MKLGPPSRLLLLTSDMPKRPNTILHLLLVVVHHGEEKSKQEEEERFVTIHV